jgi:hypothetical protein
MKRSKKSSRKQARKTKSQLHAAESIQKTADNRTETDNDTNEKYVGRPFKIRQDFLRPEYSSGVYSSFILAIFIFHKLGNTLSPSIWIWMVVRDWNRIKRSRLYRILPKWL